MHPNKKLGQYFLINKEKIKEIIDSLSIKNNDVVIEIGPGQGELTNELRIRDYEFKIIAIEKDQELVQILKKKFVADKNTEIIQGDALKLLPELIKSYKLKSPARRQADKGYKIVGNIPYYITGQLLRVVGELTSKPNLVILTLQKEVAERLCAKPPKMNLLAASVQFWADSEIIDYIPKKDFKPQPKVNSAIIRLRVKDYAVPTGRQELKITEKYYRLIKLLFKQPRKTILNNLTHGLSLNKNELIKKLRDIHINPSDRPQDLSIDVIKKLSLML